MGGAQSTPKITAQDRAILEYASHLILLYAVLKRSIRIVKSQNPARQAQTVSEESKHYSPSTDPRKGRNTWQLILPSFLRFFRSKLS